MLESPKSLTAVVHVKFHYKEPQTKPVSEPEIEMLSPILDKASELAPGLQETLVRFADYLIQLRKKEGEAG